MSQYRQKTPHTPAEDRVDTHFSLLNYRWHINAFQDPGPTANAVAKFLFRTAVLLKMTFLGSLRVNFLTFRRIVAASPSG
jgi:hypothetical protein